MIKYSHRWSLFDPVDRHKGTSLVGMLRSCCKLSEDEAKITVLLITVSWHVALIARSVPIVGERSKYFHWLSFLILKKATMPRSNTINFKTD